MFNIGIQAGAHYLLVVLSGEAGAAEIQSMNVFIADLLVRTRKTRVILDSLAFEPRLDAGAGGKQAIIAHMRETMPQLERVAVLVRSDARRGFLRGAAAGREFEAAEFTDVLEAEAWLRGSA